jgi:hypothetical protein
MSRIRSGWRKLILVPALAVTAPAADAGAAVPFEEPRSIVSRVGVARMEQGISVDLAGGAGRAALFEDTGAGGGYITRRLVIRAADGSWSRPIRVPEDARIAGNAAGDVAVTGTTASAVELRLLARDAAAPVVETLAGAGSPLGPPGLAEDGTLALVMTSGDAVTLRRRAPDGTWTTLPLDLTPALGGGSDSGVAVAVLGVLPEPDGSTRIAALTVALQGGVRLLHVRVQADGSLAELDETPVALSEDGMFGLSRSVRRLRAALAPGGAIVAVVPDRGGSSASPTLRLVAYTRAAAGGWTRSLVREQPQTYGGLQELQSFGVGVALDADGTAAVGYHAWRVGVFVRPAGSARWGRRITLQTLDTDQGYHSVPGIALAGGQLHAVWGANPYLIQRGGNEWRLVARTLAVGPASLAGGAWPTVLEGLAPVRAVRAGLRTRLLTSVRLARGPATVFVALEPCTPRCQHVSDPEVAIQGRVGANAINFVRRLVPGRYRLRVYTFGPVHILERSRLVVVR